MQTQIQTQTQTQLITEDSVLIPRLYQVEAIQWLYERKRAMLTDSPGLGKTLEAADASELPCLVVAPKHLIEQWADFLRVQYPDTKVVLVTGTRKEREALLDEVADWHVLNVQMLHSYAMPTNIKTIIFDESHHLRNRNSLQSRAAKALVDRERKSGNDIRVYMLTASPMWKSIDDIWMQLHILYPTIFSSYHEFINAFCVVVQEPYGPKVKAIKKHMRKQLENLLTPIKMGRTYRDVGRALPPVIETVVKINLSDTLQKVYADVKKEYQVEYGKEPDKEKIIFTASAMLNALRQITFCKEKIEAICNIIEDNGKPTVVGCWYKDHALRMYEALGKGNTVLITGDIDATERQRMARQAQMQRKHIVATEASLCEGVNLYQYRQVVMAEEHWPPGANYQFLSRVIRDRNDNGQDMDPVLVYYVHARKTVDEGIHRIAKRRQASIKEVVVEALV